MKVLDVGGRDVNGGARRFFESRGCKFVCLDMEADPSVDVVAPPGEPCARARNPSVWRLHGESTVQSRM